MKFKDKPVVYKPVIAGYMEEKKKAKIKIIAFILLLLILVFLY